MTILVAALEPSANLHLRQLLLALREIGCEFCLRGIYDEGLCEDLGVKPPQLSSHEFGAMGFLEVLPLVLKAKRAMSLLATLEADLFLAIDSPAFNLPLAKKLSKERPDLKKIYYILPQVWAWKAKRAGVVRKHFDILASIWPFEKDFYENCTYVGQPLLDELPAPFKKKEKLECIAFLPGSRKGEIKRLMKVFNEFIKTSDKKFILCIPPFYKDKIAEVYGDVSAYELGFSTPCVLEKADFAFICSGTATLEAALLQRPFLLCFKARWLDIKIAKMFVKLKHAGLANIIMDFLKAPALHPELIQEELSVKSLQDGLKSYDYDAFYKGCNKLRSYLGAGAAKKLATIIKNLKENLCKQPR